MPKITVRATAPGYYGIYREEGAVFDIEDEKAFSKRWMSKDVDGTGEPSVVEPVAGAQSEPPEDEQGAETKSNKARDNAEASKKSGGKRSVI